jgi:hypothetical protein
MGLFAILRTVKSCGSPPTRLDSCLLEIKDIYEGHIPPSLSTHVAAEPPRQQSHRGCTTATPFPSHTQRVQSAGLREAIFH